MENQRKPYETTLELIPKNGMIIVEMPVIAKKTPSGLHKTDKQIQEEANKMPKFVKVVGIAEDVYDVKVGEFVMLAEGSMPRKVVINDLFYGLIENGAVIATAIGGLEKESSDSYEKYKAEFLEERRKAKSETASSLILGASRN